MADEIVLFAELVRNADEFRKKLTELRQRVETLTAERDEARRSYCFVAHCHNENPDAVAKRHGWDCFKDDADAR